MQNVPHTMTPYIFDGKKFAKERETLLLNKVEELRGRGITPKLAAILIGDDPASKIYIALKAKAAERVGITLQLIKLKRADAQQIIHLIKELNVKNSVNGIMVQLPLPGELDVPETRDVILNSIAPGKDVDGLREKSPFVPAAVKAVLYAISEAQRLGYIPKDLKGVKVCVVGATGMVGKGVVGAMRDMGVKVLTADVKTKNLKAKTRQADVVFSATGVPGIIKGNMVKKGSVVIDVGAPRGDVDFKSVSKVASFITPVPGGIGPVTVVSLLENVIEACYNMRQYTHSGFPPSLKSYGGTKDS